MKKFNLKTLLAAGAVLAAAATMPQQAEAISASGNASASVLQALTVTQATALSFGSFEAGSGGTVSISVGNARSFTGGITLGPAPGGRGEFTITGSTDAAISVDPISTITLTDQDGNGGSPMAVTFDITGAPTTLTGGSVTLNVGATLTVASGQAPSNYAGTYTVTVNYN